MTANNEAQAIVHNNASTPNIEYHTRRADLRFVLFVSNEVVSDIVIEITAPSESRDWKSLT